MKQKKQIYILILVLTTLVGLWGVPALVKKITYSPESYPFVYYSSIIKDLCLIDYKNKDKAVQDLKGNFYTTAEADSILPLLNYRQLMVDGRLPDSIDGNFIEPKLIRVKSVNYRYFPRDFDMPELGLGVLFEAMPKRVGLELPPDVFRMNDRIEFVDAETNAIDVKKSAQFQKAVEKEGYIFPSQWISGNPNIRKPYEEGYFCLDSNGGLFHLKLVNNRPYFKNTHLGDSINIASFAMYEATDKRFYGFLFSKEGDVHIVSYEEGKYFSTQLGIDPINIEKDQMTIMGNPLYWTVTVTSDEGRKYYGLKTETLERVGQHSIAAQGTKWDEISKWVSPFYLTFEDSNTKYIQPQFTFTGFNFLIVNLVLALLVGIFVPNTKNRKIFNSVYILITGVAGLIALMVLPNFRKKIK